MSEQALFPKKWEKKLPADFKESAETFSNDDLKSKIVEWQQEISETERRMESDDKLLMLKEEVKERSSVYKDTVGMHQAMVRYAVYLLEGRGQA